MPDRYFTENAVIVKTLYINLRLLALFAVVLLAACESQEGDLSVVIGPTPIPRGDAQGARDITVISSKFAISFGVDTAPPWGVARGGILDVAIIENGEIGLDIVSLVDFMPNNWSSWPTTYQTVTLEKSSEDEVIVRSKRDWGKVELDSTFRILKGDTRIEIRTSMTNKGDTLVDLRSGYVVWPDGGYLFSVPGLTGIEESAEDDALADWSASYDRNWSLGLHAGFSTIVSQSGRDRYLEHTLGAGESKTFEAVFQIEDRGDLAAMVREEIRSKSLGAGTVSARISDASSVPVSIPALVAMQRGKSYTWAIGQNGLAELQLPAGDYQVYATAEGYSASEPKSVRVAAGGKVELDIGGLNPPGSLLFKTVDAATLDPLDARISVKSGHQSLIGYFGRSTFFTELDPVGQISFSIAPGDYQFEVSAGGGFTSSPQDLVVAVLPGKTTKVIAAIPVITRPQEHGWYSGDLHHHSDVLDGFTEPEFVMRSELASGVDVTFLSDHDSVVNNADMQKLSAARGIGFIPGTELSASWAHFNAYPLDDGKTIDIDIGASSVQAIFNEARRLGADVVSANHPYNDYGYFGSLDNNDVPGGYDDRFDAVEMTTMDNQQTLDRTWSLWNEGKRAYLVGGSDAHDVWTEISGASRTYVQVDGPLTISNFVAALKAGHSYASQGPIVYPETPFGSELTFTAGTSLNIVFDAIASSGLRSVKLVERGTVVDTLAVDGETTKSNLSFTVRPKQDTWYSLLIEDTTGKLAYTNPVWVTETK